MIYCLKRSEFKPDSSFQVTKVHEISVNKFNFLIQAETKARVNTTDTNTHTHTHAHKNKLRKSQWERICLTALNRSFFGINKNRLTMFAQSKQKQQHTQIKTATTMLLKTSVCCCFCFSSV